MCCKIALLHLFLSHCASLVKYFRFWQLQISYQLTFLLSPAKHFDDHFLAWTFECESYRGEKGESHCLFLPPPLLILLSPCPPPQTLWLILLLLPSYLSPACRLSSMPPPPCCVARQTALHSPPRGRKEGGDTKSLMQPSVAIASELATPLPGSADRCSGTLPQLPAIGYPLLLSSSVCVCLCMYTACAIHTKVAHKYRSKYVRCIKHTSTVM